MVKACKYFPLDQSPATLLTHVREHQSKERATLTEIKTRFHITIHAFIQYCLSPLPLEKKALDLLEKQENCLFDPKPKTHKNDYN